MLGMVVFQILFAGLNIFYKLAVSDGMDLRVLIAYRYLFASAFLAPLAYFLERYWIYYPPKEMEALMNHSIVRRR